MSAPERHASPAPVDGWTRWLKRDQLFVSLGLVGLLGLAWLDLLRRAGVLTPLRLGRQMAMPQAGPWGIADVGLTAAMWAVMMAAMMLPAAVPMLLLFSTANQKRQGRGTPVVPTGIFLLGYLTVWAGFSCCWALMAVLFVGGIMNLAWIALIAALVLLERLWARGMLASRTAGVLLALWGLWLVWAG